MIKKTIFCGLLVFSLGSCAYTLPPNAQNQQGVTEYSAILHQLEETRKEIRSLQGDVDRLRTDIAGLKTGTLPTAPGNNQGSTPPVAGPQPIVLKNVAFEDDPVLGDRKAKVGIVEFTDYQCPFCKRHHEQTFSRIKETYIDTGKVQYIIRDFPLAFHQHANGAAIAANCAGNQGAYWEMSHQLFINQARLGTDLYGELGENLNLDMQKYEACRLDDEQSKEVNSDHADGKILGIRGTPNFFIGLIKGEQLVKAKQLTGAQPYSVFAKEIDSLLQ